MNRNPNIKRGPPFGQGQSFNPQLRPQIPRPNPINRTILTSREYDPLIITQLLLKVSTENNLLELKKFIMENGITTNDMLNEDGQSILHLILINANLSKRQKMEMVRFLRDNGTLISSFDKLNQTPLHIACKAQLYDIVVELINAGHDVNAVDSSYKTPLHYSVIGKSTEIPDKVDKKIFPKTKLKIKTDTVPNITKKILEYIEKSDLKKFIENQYNTFANSHNIFKKDIDTILNDQNVIAKITDILIDPQLTEETRSQKILDISSETNKKVREFLLSKVTLTKKQLSMEPNTDNGWGPDNLSVNKVLEYNNITDLNTFLTSEQTVLLQNMQSKKSDTDIKVTDNITQLNEELNNLNDINYSALFLHRFLNEVSNMIDMTGMMTNNIPRLLFTDVEIENNFIYNFTNPIFEQYYYIGSLKESDQCDLQANTCTNKAGNVTDISGFGVINRLDNVINKKYERQINALFTDYERDVTSGAFINNLNGALIQQFMVMVTTPYLTVSGSPVYNLTRKLELSTTNMIKYFDELKISIDNILTNINQSHSALNNISESIINLLSILNELPKYFREYTQTMKYFENIKNLVKAKSTTPTGVLLNGNTYNITILYESLLVELESILNIMGKNNSDRQVTYFNLLKSYYDIINQSINYVNSNNSNILIQKYFNDFANFDILIQNGQSELLDNIFENKIEDLNPFFKSFDDLSKSLKVTDIQADQIQNKTILIKKFLLQLTQKYNYVLIDSALGVNANSKVGYLTNITLLNTLDIDINSLELKFGVTGEPTLFINDADDTNASPTRKQGSYQIKAAYSIDKKNGLFPIIGDQFDKYFMIQKYIITRRILNEIYSYLLNTGPIVPGSLEDDIKKLDEQIIRNVKSDRTDKSIILITIGKIIDKLFNVNLDNIITNTTNDYAYRYERNQLNPGNYDLVNISSLNKVDLSSLNFDDIDKQLYKLIKKNKKLDLSMYNNAEELTKRNKQPDNIYKIMASNIGDDPAELYMEFDKDLIEFLINNGADVNARDKDGNTPLCICILQSNASAVDYLLTQNVSVDTKKSKNRLGYKPLDLAKNNVNIIIQNFDTEINEKSLEEIIKETNDEIMKLTKINHNMRYHDIIIKMTLYLLNHVFYSKLNNKTKTGLHQEIFKLITTQITELPLVSNIDNIFISYHKLIADTLVNKEKELTSNTEEYDKLTLEKENLRREIVEINKTIPVNSFRITEINDAIIQKDSEQQKISNRKDKRINPIKTSNSVKNNDLIIQLKTAYKTKSITSDPLKLYDNIFDSILTINPNDYRTYTILWDNLFKNKIDKKESDETQIINKIFEVIKDNMNDYDKIDLCASSLDILISDIENYFALPMEYNDVNYLLNTVIDIIKHVVKNTMIVNLYHTIIKLLRADLIIKIPQQSDERDNAYNIKIQNIINEIMDTEINNVSLKKYLFETLTEKLVKVTLNIYEGDDDDDKNTNIITLLTFIDKLLASNTKFSIINVDESKTLKMLTQNVYPYFKNYFEINIKKMKKVVDGYLSMLLTFGLKLNILQKVLQKAKTEQPI
jgi:ankyrin repeat protein